MFVDPTHHFSLQLTEYCKEGPNKIVLSRSDSRMFSLGVRIAKRRSLQEVTVMYIVSQKAFPHFHCQDRLLLDCSFHEACFSSPFP